MTLAEKNVLSALESQQAEIIAQWQEAKTKLDNAQSEYEASEKAAYDLDNAKNFEELYDKMLEAQGALLTYKELYQFACGQKKAIAKALDWAKFMIETYNRESDVEFFDEATA